MNELVQGQHGKTGNAQLSMPHSPSMHTDRNLMHTVETMLALAMWYRLMLPTPCSATKRAKGTVRS